MTEMSRREMGKPLKTTLLYSWKFFPNSIHSHWLLRGHMTSNNETVSLQNLWAGNITKFMTSEGSSALKIHILLPANVDWRPSLQQGLLNFQLYNKSLYSWSLSKQLILFPSDLSVSWGWQGKHWDLKETKIFFVNINCVPRDQSFRIL